MAFATFDAQRTPAPVAEINMVPLIDVMLVLLVIFILTAPLFTHAVPLQLPRASLQPHQPQPRRIEIAIDASGQRYWAGQPLSREEVRSRLADEARDAQARQAEHPQIQLRADEAAAYRELAQTLADAAAAGLTRIAFLSEPESRR